MPAQFQLPQNLDALLYGYRQRVPLTARGARGGAVYLTDATMDGTTGVVTSASLALGPVNAALAKGGVIVAWVEGAGAAGAPLISTVASYQGPGQITLADVSQTAVAGVQAGIGPDDSTAINLITASYGTVDLEGEQFLAWGIKPSTSGAAVFGNGTGRLIQSKLGTNTASQKALFTREDADMSSFYMAGVKLQGIPYNRFDAWNAPLAFLGHSLTDATPQGPCSLVDVETRNFQGTTSLSRFSDLTVRSNRQYLCSGGYNINGCTRYLVDDYKFIGSQWTLNFPADNGKFIVALSFNRTITDATGISNGNGQALNVLIQDVDNCEGFLVHDADIIEIGPNVVLKNIGYGYSLNPTAGTQMRINEIHHHDSIYIGRTSGDACVPQASGLAVNGNATNHLLLYKARNNYYESGNQSKQSTSGFAYGTGDYIDNIDIDGDRVYNSYANAVALAQLAAATHIAKARVRNMTVDGVNGGSAVLFHLGFDCTEIGILSKINLHNGSFGFDWDNLAHAHWGTPGDNFVAASVTTKTTNGGGSGVAPVASSTLGQLF